MLIWIKWLEKRAIRIEIRWEETNPEIGEREREREREIISWKNVKERESYGRWDPLIFELLKAPPFICGEPIPPTSFFLFFDTSCPRALLTLPSHVFFFFIQLFATKAFCSFQKRSSKMQFLCSRKSEYISFVLLYLSARIFLKFYAFFFWPFRCIYLLLFF